MDVQHHPDIRSKGFKEYVLEFIMIFLAVTLGFFAEQIRERLTERSRERDLALSLVEDIRKDTARLNEIERGELQWAKWADSLCITIDRPFSKIKPADFYRYGFNISIFQSLTFKEAKGTVDQLRNSGYLRYFINTRVPNMLADYEAQIETLVDFEKLEAYWINEYQGPFMLEHSDPEGVKAIFSGGPMPSVLTLNKLNQESINQHFNRILALRKLNNQVVEMIRLTRQKAVNFMEAIEEDYRIKKHS